MKLVAYSKNGKECLAVGEFRGGIFVGVDELKRPVRLKKVNIIFGDVEGEPYWEDIKELITENDIFSLWEIGEDMSLDEALDLLGKNSAEGKASLYFKIKETPYFKFLKGKLLRRSEDEVGSIKRKKEADAKYKSLRNDIDALLEGKSTSLLKAVLEIYNYGPRNDEIGKTLSKYPDFWNRFLDTGLVGPENIPFEIRLMMKSNDEEYYGYDFPYEDLTELNTFSIDDEDTEDIDDAISLHKDKLYIHIALPYSLVSRGCGADREALKRGSTLYLPDGKWHMYPLEVVRGLSLNEGEERMSLTLEVSLDDYLIMESYRFKVAKIINKKRLSYKNAESWLRSQGMWDKLLRICENLRNVRIKKGGVIVENFFLKVKYSSGIIEVSVYPPTDTGRIVSELMILYNSLAGRFISKKNLPGIFRIQEEGIKADVPTVDDPLYFPKIKALASPVKSSTRPGPHRLAGVDFYARASSPIRRYSDVLNQHQILAGLGYVDPLDEDTINKEMRTALSGENKRHKAQKYRNTFLILHKIRELGKVKGIAYDRKSVFLPDFLFMNAKSKAALDVGRFYTFKVEKVLFSSQKVLLSPLE